MILLDTHVLIEYNSGKAVRLGPRSWRLVEKKLARGMAGVSAVTFWEAAMLAKKGRVCLESDPDNWREKVLRRGFKEIPLDGKTAVLSVGLEMGTADPFDRLISAATLRANARLLTADEALLASDIPVLDARK